MDPLPHFSRASIFSYCLCSRRQQQAMWRPRRLAIGIHGDIYALGAGEFKPQQRYREVSCVMLRGGGAGDIYALGAGEFKPQQRYREVSCAMLRGGGTGGIYALIITGTKRQSQVQNAHCVLGI